MEGFIGEEGSDREWWWDGNNVKTPLFISAPFQMRWKVMKETEPVSLSSYDFYICACHLDEYKETDRINDVGANASKCSMS